MCKFKPLNGIDMFLKGVFNFYTDAPKFLIVSSFIPRSKARTS